MTTNPGAVPLPSGTLDDVFTRWSVPECARAEIRQAHAALVAGRFAPAARPERYYCFVPCLVWKHNAKGWRP